MTLRFRISPITLAVVLALFAALFAPVIINMMRAGNDYPIHITWAVIWDETGVVPNPLPHFLYQVSIIAASRVMPANSYNLAAAFIGIVSYSSLGLLIFGLVHPLINSRVAWKRTLTSLMIALALMLLGPINLLTWNNHNLSLGYLPAHSYHNPTIVLLKPFALGLFLFAIRVFNPCNVGRMALIGCAAVAFLGTIAKPNYMIAIIPALMALVLLALVRRQKVNWPLLVIGIAVPAVEVLVWQLNYVKGSELSGFALAPFAVMSAYSPDNLLLKFICSILFPLLVVVFYWRAALNDVSLKIAWLTFASGAFYTYFLAENRSYTDGNFTWSGQITVFILFVAATLFLIRHNRESFTVRPLSWRLVICVLAFLLHLASGIALYLPHLHSDWRLWL